MEDEKKVQRITDGLLNEVNLSYDQAVLVAKTAVSLAHNWTTLSHLSGKRESLRIRTFCTATQLSVELNAHGTPRHRALHGIDVCCPLHGTPPPGGRLRPRLRAIDVDRVRTAMAYRQQLIDVEHQIYTLHEQIYQMEKVLITTSENVPYLPQFLPLRKD